MLKKVLIGVAAFVLVVVVALVALLALVDVDHYKPQIEAAAHDKLDRTLKFDGKLSLSVFPSIAVALPHTTLSEHGSDRPFLSLDRARVSLAVLPLLSGRLEAGTASLYGLRASIDRRADGTTNLDDLTGGAKPKSSGEDGASQSGGGPAPQFELGGIELVDAQVIYRDEHAHNTLSVSKLNLKIGRLARELSTWIESVGDHRRFGSPSAVSASGIARAGARATLLLYPVAIRGTEARAANRQGATRTRVSSRRPGRDTRSHGVASRPASVSATSITTANAKMAMIPATIGACR